jgi:hypothetical protein
VQHHTNSEQGVGKGGAGETAGKATLRPKVPTVEQLTHESDFVELVKDLRISESCLRN